MSAECPPCSVNGAIPLRRLRHQFLRRLAERPGRPLVIAHRGDSRRAPENTLPSAQRSWEAGADAWELDVQLTRDGVPVVIHDASLGRTTNVADVFSHDPREEHGCLVAHFDFDEVRRLDAGAWFVANRPIERNAAWFGARVQLEPSAVAEYASGAVRVPSLREALELTARLGWLVNVELKSTPDRTRELLDAVLSDVRRLGLVDRVLLSSFDHRELARARVLECEIATGALAATPLYQPERYLTEIVEADCYHVSAMALGADGDRSRPWPVHLAREDVARLRDRHVPVLVYTVNDAAPDGLAEELASIGVDGLFTDDPLGMRDLFSGGPHQRRRPSR